MKLLPFSETLAHQNDPLPEHLLRVAKQASNSILSNNKEAKEIAFIAGLFHDIGKSSYYFQERLRETKPSKPNKLTSHSEISAILAWWYTSQLNWDLWKQIAVFNAIHRHHSALKCKNWDHFLTNAQYEMIEEKNSHLHKQLDAIDLIGIQQWLEHLFEKKLPTLTKESVIESLEKIKGFKIKKAFQHLDQSIISLVSFGGLLATDKIDAALKSESIEREDLPSNSVDNYKLNRFIEINELNKMRSKIAEEVLETWQNNISNSLFTFTAPTGSGKTLAILNTVLKIREQIQIDKNYLPRIIYCLPFTAIIDQNYAVFEDVLKLSTKLSNIPDNLLLKHHHLTDYTFKTEEAEYEKDGVGQLLIETWQSEIVVTTFYQLLYTLFSSLNANLKRAGQLAGSIILMDEVQAIPVKYWQAIRNVFNTLAETFNTKFVLLTATRPLIFEKDKSIELLPNHDSYFKSLSRVQLFCKQNLPISLEQFSDKIIEQYQEDNKATLIILNTKSAVKELYELLKENLPNVLILTLSTNFTPIDRKIRIRLIKRWLKQKKPCIVITTQLIEAGVDVSFPIVHRDFAPLDSIIQSAGRCNRHNEEKEGEVYLWTLQNEHNKKFHERIYDSTLTQSTIFEESIYQENDFLQLSERYFEQINARFSSEPVDEWLKEGNFEKIEKQFKLIEEKPQRSLFIIKNAKDKQIWEEYREIYRNEKNSPLEKKQAFQKIRKSLYERVIQVFGKYDPNEPIEKIEASEITYNKQIGFIGEDNRNIFL
jgi:CRISPR-associated endonuclease/helicase Cas3